MKLKGICWLLAVALLLSAVTLPMDAYATETEPTQTEVTEPTTEAEQTEPTETALPTEETKPTEETEPVDESWHVSDEMMAVLKKMEGFAAYAYWDYKQWSIGYGSECPKGKEQYYQKNPITEEYAEELLRGELNYFEKEVNDFIKEKGLNVTQSQYDALVSFSYNCGANWTTETTGYFHKGVLSGNLGSEFVYGMFLWSTAGGQYVLLPRRICETYMYVQGVYDYKLSWYYENEQYRYIFMDGNGGKVNYYVHGFDVNDPTAIRTQVTAPKGPDESGAMVTYVLDGWYTEREGGTKVELLDRTITSGTVLYAHWKTPAGTPVTVPAVDTGMNLKITVQTDGVNLRRGPQTYFASVGKANKGDELILNEVRSAGGRLWGRAGDKWICLVDAAPGYQEYTNYKSIIAEMFPIWGKVTADEVNVRSGAGTNNSIVTQKNKGDLVLIKEWVSDGERMWGKTDEGYIALSYVTFEDVDPERQIISVVVQKKPSKLQYLHKTETLDLAGGTILITYSDGTSQEITMTSEMVSGFDSAKVGKQTLTVTYEGITAQFEVEILKTMVSVSVKQKPSKLRYRHRKENLDLTGGKILVTYSDESTEEVAMTAEMVTGFDNTTVGFKTLTVTYKGFTTQFEIEIVKLTASVALKQKPAKLQYLHKTETLDLTGGSILVTYSDGSTKEIAMTAEMVTGFDNTVIGFQTLSVTSGGLSAKFEIEIIKAKVIFKMDDGTVISEKEYLVGDTVEIPETPQKPGDPDGEYVFAGWDKEVTVCNGHAVYTAVFKRSERVGDVNHDGIIDTHDAVYLLRHALFAELYPFEGTKDLNGDGIFNGRDAVHLLRYVLFPELYPLPN